MRRGPGFTYGPGGSAGSACPLAAVFDTSFQMSVLRASPNGTATIAGLIPDGFTQVAGGGRKADVVGNVYLLKDVPIGATLTATGPGGTRTALVGGRTGQLPSPERRVF